MMSVLEQKWEISVVPAVQYLDIASHGSFHHLWTFNMLYKIGHDPSIYYEFIITRLWIGKITISENIVSVRP